jgi:hypothetical protein
VIDRNFNGVGKVVEHYIGETRTTGTPYVALRFEVEEPLDFQGEEVSAKLWLSEKAFEFTLDKLSEILGWQGDDLEEINGAFDGVFALEGRRCNISVKSNSFDNDKGEKITYYEVAGIYELGSSGNKNAMAEEGVGLLAKKYKSKIRAYRNSKGQEVKKAKPSTMSNDDAWANEADVPF